MAKQTWKPGTLLAPLPPALITSGTLEHPNVMTAAWTGIICSDPALTYVSLRPSRYTHELVSRYKEFAINLPTWRIAEAVDTVGVKSGRDNDKFVLTGLTAEPCARLKAPQIAECPVSLECKVLEVRPFGTHDMFLAEIVAVNVDEKYIDENGALDLEKAGLIAYAHGFYYTLGRKLGKFGFSVEKKKKRPAAPSVATLIKADEKFGKPHPEEKFSRAAGKDVRKSALKPLSKKKRPPLPPLKGHVPGADKVFVENGIEVVVKKPRLHLPETAKAAAASKTAISKKREQGKFSRKKNKGTRYEPYSFKRKADGSFKKKSPQKK